MDLEKLKFPIGNYSKPIAILEDELELSITNIEEFPTKILNLTKNLTLEQLNWNYRPNGWSIKQVVHHCADSHSNAYLRTKLALTQILPVINPYNEAVWAELIDANTNSIQDSLSIIKGIHARWTLLLKNLNANDLEKQYYHPQNNRNYAIKEVIVIYAWHCNHHLAHIKQALLFKNDFDKIK